MFSSSASVITSDTKGYLNYIEVAQAEMKLISNWKAHDFESWIAAFNYADTNIIYSGNIFLIYFLSLEYCKILFFLLLLLDMFLYNIILDI